MRIIESERARIEGDERLKERSISYLIDRNENELHQEPDEAHHGESNGRFGSNHIKLLPVDEGIAI